MSRLPFAAVSCVLFPGTYGMPEATVRQRWGLFRYAGYMNVFDEKRTELERHEFMMGVERGRLAVALGMLTDSLILIGQHGVYCTSSRNPSVPALDLQVVLGGMEGAKALIQSVMEELRAQRDGARAQGPSAG